MREKGTIDNLPTVPDMITDGIERAGKTHRQIAREMGMSETQTSVLTMIKKGDMRLPISKIGPFSRVLGLDPRILFLSALKEKLVGPPHSTKYSPESWEFAIEYLRNTHNDNEAALLDVFRDVQLELGHEITIDENFKKLFAQFLKDAYSL